MLTCVNLAFGQIQSLSFSSLDINDGLTQGNISDILQDEKGFIWIATADGLNRYDGYEVKTFRKSYEDTTSLPDNQVQALFEDKKGQLWLGTETHGLVKYNRSNGHFQTIIPRSASGNKLLEKVNTINSGPNGNLWLGGRLNSLVKYDLQDSTFHFYPLFPGKLQNDTNQFYNVKVLKKDESGNFWVGTEFHGLIHFDPKQGKTLKQFSQSTSDLSSNYVADLCFGHGHKIWVAKPNGLVKVSWENQTGNTSYKVETISKFKDNYIRSIHCDTSGDLWLGTFGSGLGRYRPQKGQLKFYRANPDKAFGLSQNTINVIQVDRSGTYWLGTNGRGVNWFSLNKSFNQYSNLPNRKSAQFNNSVRAILEDHRGHIWIGSYAGLDCYLPDEEMVKSYPYDSIPGGYNYNANVYSLYEDSQNRLWVGSEGGGLYHFDRKQDTFIKYGEPAYPFDFIYDILEGPESQLWLATAKGLVAFSPKTGQFETYLKDQAYGHFLYLTLDDRNRLWVACESGYFIFDPSTQNYQHFGEQNLPVDSGLLSQHVYSFYQSDSSTMWAGTKGGGLTKINLNAQQNPQSYKHFTKNDGLPNNVVYGILEADNGDLWVSTNDGLARIYPQQGVLAVYGHGDGLQSDEFNAGAFHETDNGKFFFGGINGLNSFKPEKVTQNSHKPPVVLKSIEKMGEPIQTAKPIPDLESITLAHEDDIVTLTFAALNYQNAKENAYAYKLEGFMNEWEYTGQQRQFTFTNLDPGHYTLRVKASNNDGVWNEQGRAIDIKVIPPFWQTYWFYGLVALGLSGILGGGYYWRVRAMRKYQQRLEQEVEQRTKDLEAKNEELIQAKAAAEKADRAKSDFLASMSHEIRTPMNAVVGMTDLLKDTKLNADQQEYLDAIQNSGQNLLNIINDILDLSKIEADQLELENKAFNLRSAVDEVVELFGPKAMEQGVDLGAWVDQQIPAVVRGDETRLKQVMANLLSNALKFTHEGYVKLSVTLPDTFESLKEGDTVYPRFEVADTGIGIKQADLKKLFHNFSQVDASTTRKYGGTGLGLAICNKLVRLMDGAIHVDSEVDEGSVFSFRIKLPVDSVNERQQSDMPDQLAGYTAMIIGSSAVTPYLIQAYLQELGAGVQIGYPENLASPENQSCLSKAAIVGWDQDEISLKKLKDAMPEFREGVVWLAFSFKPVREGDHSLIKKPIKRAKLQKAVLDLLNKNVPNRTAVSTSPKRQSPPLADDVPLHLLLVEDNYLNQKVILKQLQKLGYDPVTCYNGNEVLALMEDQTFDLVFMDIQMPEMDGMEATKRIHQKLPDKQRPRIVALTANAVEADHKQYLAAGMDDYLIKPFKPEDIETKIRNWFPSKKPLKAGN